MCIFVVTFIWNTFVWHIGSYTVNYDVLLKIKTNKHVFCVCPQKRNTIFSSYFVDVSEISYHRDSDIQFSPCTTRRIMWNKIGPFSLFKGALSSWIRVVYMVKRTLTNKFTCFRMWDLNISYISIPTEMLYTLIRTIFLRSARTIIVSLEPYIWLSTQINQCMCDMLQEELASAQELVISSKLIF